MSGGEEFPPLLAAGFWKMSASELHALVVNKFPGSTRRPALWSDFSFALDELKRLYIPCVVWVDGSFLTEKIEPKDVDFVIEVELEFLDTCNAEQAALLERFSDRALRTRPVLHSFVMPSAPPGHSFHQDALRLHAQWKKDFGHSYVKREQKGIAQVEVLA